LGFVKTFPRHPTILFLTCVMNIDDDDGGATWLDQQLYHFHLAELDASPTRYNNRSMDGMSQTSTLIQPEVVCAAILKAHGYKVVRPSTSDKSSWHTITIAFTGDDHPDHADLVDTVGYRLESWRRRLARCRGSASSDSPRRATLGPPRSREDLITSLALGGELVQRSITRQDLPLRVLKLYPLQPTLYLDHRHPHLARSG